MSLGLYLGNPAGAFGMVQLPGAQIGGVLGSGGGVSTNLTRSTTSNVLASGGVATFRRRYTKRSYSIAWSILTASEIDILNSFFTGIQGAGPYCLVDPSWGNQLPANAASMGAVLGTFPEWVPTSGTLAVSAQLPPTGYLSGVAQWSGAGNGDNLSEGSYPIDPTFVSPVLRGVAHRKAIWAKVTSGSAHLTAAMYSAPSALGSATLVATGTPVTLSGTWQEVSVSVASSFSWASDALYVRAEFDVSSASTPVVQFAAASATYGTSTALSPWVSGVGVPRVVLPGDAPSPVDIVGWRDYVLTLAEV